MIGALRTITVLALAELRNPPRSSETEAEDVSRTFGSEDLTDRLAHSRVLAGSYASSNAGSSCETRQKCVHRAIARDFGGAVSTIGSGVAKWEYLFPSLL